MPTVFTATGNKTQGYYEKVIRIFEYIFYKIKINKM